MKKWPVIGSVLAVIWLFVKGTTLTLENVLGTFLVGLAVGLFVAYTTRDIYADEIPLGATLRSIPAAVRYLLVFTKELLVANVDVAYRVLSPSLPIDPDVVAIPLRVESDAAITSIANSITLTPGTLTMDYDEETNTLFVHAITGKHDYYSIVDPVRAWEDLALVIFEESASPDDPAPEWPDPGNPMAKTKEKTKARDGGERDGE